MSSDEAKLAARNRDWSWLAFGGATLLVLAVCIRLAMLRGGWIDEYWTVWFSDPHVAFVTAFDRRWLNDPAHPVTFYAEQWVLAHVAGERLAWRRMLNLLPVLWFGGVALLTGGDRREVAYPWLYAVALIASPFCVEYFAEYRSYYSAMLALGALVLALRQVHLRSFDGPLRKRQWLGVGVTILIALNLHYLAAMIAMTLLGWTVLDQWRRGCRRNALTLGALGAVSLLPLVAIGSVALRRQLPVSFDLSSLPHGLLLIGRVMVASAFANLALAAAALTGLRRRAADPEDRGDLRFAAVLALTLASATLELAALQGVSGNLSTRLVLGLVPITAGLVAELAALARLSRLWRFLIGANAILIAGAMAQRTLEEPRWLYNADRIAALTAHCPDAKVVAVNPLLLAPRGSPVLTMVGQSDAIALGYRAVAREHGFARNLVIGGAALDLAHRPCPTVVWMEHNVFVPAVSAGTMIALARLAVPPSQLAHAQVWGTPQHILIALPSTR